MTSATTLRFGIISTGAIAKAFALGVSQSEHCQVTAVASRSQASADEFAAKFDIPTAHSSYDDLLADDTVDAVYVATPHPMHPQWAIRAAEAGKHVLTEKPAALNQYQVQAMVQAAKRANVLYMEAFMYRCHPQTAKLVELIRDKAIGDVCLIRATFGFQAGFNPEGRLWNPTLGGGALLDVGCYPVSMSRLVAGAALGSDSAIAEPTEVKAVGHLGETGVDASTSAVLKFNGNIVAQCATTVLCTPDNTVTIFGTDGQIHIPNPWIASRNEPPTGKIIVKAKGSDEQVIDIPATMNSYGYEADNMAKAIAAGQATPSYPAMGGEDSIGQATVLDQWRQQIGLVYPDEQPRPVSENIVGRPIKSRVGESGHNMKYAELPGLDKPVSKLIFGALTAHGSFAKAQVMFDHWLEVGGNTFDSGYIYGSCDKILGQWMTSRGVREQVNVIAKGAHTPHCNPDGLNRELAATLDRLETDSVEMYVMHRDNPEIPVGEFIDCLNEHVQAGRIKIFGGSNWSFERFNEANAYAKANGKQGMTILNNNLSLAHMVDPVWGGCIHVSDKASRDALEHQQIIHMSWSSQARGFFTDRSGPDKTSDAELVRCWYSDDNFKRKQRAEKLAKKYGCLPINIAAAYVTCQPFPSFALIGPERVWEMDACLPALDIELTRDELRYLALDD